MILCPHVKRIHYLALYLLLAPLALIRTAFMVQSQLLSPDSHRKSHITHRGSQYPVLSTQVHPHRISQFTITRYWVVWNDKSQQRNNVLAAHMFHWITYAPAQNNNFKPHMEVLWRRKTSSLFFILQRSSILGLMLVHQDLPHRGRFQAPPSVRSVLVAP